MTTDEAIKINNWYTPDGQTCAFIGADGRLVIAAGMSWKYLYPTMPNPEPTEAAS